MNKSDFNILFDNWFMRSNQTAFEDWFANMAEAVFGSDFERVKAGGKHGDKKSDGRRISTETVYQCYAPESAETFAKNGAKKIQDSFPDVLKYWPNTKEWIFVHNNAGGIPTGVSDALEEIRSAYPHLKIRHASRRFLKDQLHDKMSVQQLIDIYPSANLDFSAVTMDVIRPLLRKIVEGRKASAEPHSFGEIPDQDKLDFNQISPDGKYNLTRAYYHVDLVQRYLDGLNMPQQATEIQRAMRTEYLKWKSLGHTPDEILGKMLVFSGNDGTPTIASAAYVIVTYYFDACDIFENIPELA